MQELGCGSRWLKRCMHLSGKPSAQKFLMLHKSPVHWLINKFLCILNPRRGNSRFAQLLVRTVGVSTIELKRYQEWNRVRIGTIWHILLPSAEQPGCSCWWKPQTGELVSHSSASRSSQETAT